MVELLATIGVAAKELFEYNRDMYQFDQGQRLERDLLRLEMQVKRFSLFREDIRDLVELTVGKMEMYHAVGALAIWFCITWYTEGRIRSEAPPFIVSLYWLSIAGAFVYLLLTVWLSMHASVTSHSFGVRLLTRFVRLPIPGIQQINALNPNLTDFENQGWQNVMRVPFVRGPQEWKTHASSSIDEPKAHSVDHDKRYNPLVQSDGMLQMQDLLEKGEVPLDKEHDFHREAKLKPGKHVQLFRNLQMKWQCYDAYARVCMSLGMNQVLMSACFYLVCATLLEYHAPSLCFALIAIFQACSLAMSILDVSGVKRRKLVCLWFFGSLMPVVIAAVEITVARHNNPLSQIAPDEPSDEFTNATQAVIFRNDYYNFECVPFFLIALWMLGLLLLAWPSADEKTLPRLFRSVLFVDVFSLEDSGPQAVGTKDGADQPTASMEAERSSAEEPLTQEQAGVADEACYIAEAALRRWEAVPAGTSEANDQGADLVRYRKNLTFWRKALNLEATRIAGTHGDTDAVAMLEVDNRTWNELPPEEQAQDPWAWTLLGPFEHTSMASYYYYDLEKREFVWEVPEGRDVLSVQEVAERVELAEVHVRAVLSRDLTSAEDGEQLLEAVTVTQSGHLCCGKQAGTGFVPERLPWFTLKYMTLTLMAAWLFEGLFLLAEEYDLIKSFDYAEQVIPEPSDAEIEASRHSSEAAGGDEAHEAHIYERRLSTLAATASWNFKVVEVFWPRGLFFQPEALACLPKPHGALLISSPEALHWAPMPAADRPAPLQLTPMPTLAPLVSTAVLCGPQGKALFPADTLVPCFLGAPTSEGITLWRPSSNSTSEAVTLPIVGRPWKQMAGAAVHCTALLELLPEEDPVEMRQQSASWCLLLVGWDGQHLPVAAVRLPKGPAAVLPASSARVIPIFDVPLLPSSTASGATASVVKDEVTSLHVEPDQGRLWALRADGGLQSWDLLRPRHLGHWRPAWTAQAAAMYPGAFRATALCEDRLQNRLLVLGRHGTEGTQLLWSPVPGVLERL